MEFYNVVKSKKEKDEYYTPPYAIEPILKYIPIDATIWCPFDTEDSNYVKMFRQRGNKVIFSHIDMGVDFLNCEIPECDYIVSNPPYSLKNEVFDRLFSIGKPFAMLVAVFGLFESQKRFNMFSENSFEIMYFNLRVSYFKSYKDQKPSLNPPFSSVYLCSGILPKQIVFERLVKK